MLNALGVIVSGRLVNKHSSCSVVASTNSCRINVHLYYLQVQTDFQQITDVQYLINIPEADNVNHVVVFLTGTTPFAEGMAGAGK